MLPSGSTGHVLHLLCFFLFSILTALRQARSHGHGGSGSRWALVQGRSEPCPRVASAVTARNQRWSSRVSRRVRVRPRVLLHHPPVLLVGACLAHRADRSVGAIRASSGLENKLGEILCRA
jgi:hypothetical protein